MSLSCRVEYCQPASPALRLLGGPIVWWWERAARSPPRQALSRHARQEASGQTGPLGLAAVLWAAMSREASGHGAPLRPTAVFELTRTAILEPRPELRA
jgi:hypothetical protein